MNSMISDTAKMTCTYEDVTSDRISATDLRGEIAEAQSKGQAVETAHIWIEGHAECADALFLPEIGMGGVAWGADATWTNCTDMANLVARFAAQDMSEA